MIKSYNASASTCDTVNVTLDGNGFAITGSGYMFTINGYGFVMKNLTINSTHGFTIASQINGDTPSFTMDNCKFPAVRGVTLKLTGGNMNVVVKNSEIIYNEGWDSFVQKNSNPKGPLTLTLENTYLSYLGGANAKQENYAFNFSHNDNTITVNLKGNTRIEANSHDSKDLTGGMFFFGICKARPVINIESGVTLKLSAPQDGYKKYSYFVRYYNGYMSVPHVIINDAGATWQIAKEALNTTTVILPDVGDDVIWKVNDTYVRPCDEYKSSTTFTEDVTLVKVNASELTEPELEEIGFYSYSVGSAKYNSMYAAFEAARSGDTIKLLRDVVTFEILTIPAGRDNLTFDGNNHSISPQGGYGNNDYFARCSSQNLVVKNLTLNYAKGFYYGGSNLNTIELQNCNITVTGGIAIQVDGTIASAANANVLTVNISGCNITSTATAGDSMTLFKNHYGVTTVNVTDSNLTYYGGSNAGQENYIFNLANNIDATVLNIKGNTTLISASRKTGLTSSTAKHYGIFCQRTMSVPYTVNLESTVTLKLDKGSDFKNAANFFGEPYGQQLSNIVVNDQGASYVISKDLANSSIVVTLPANSTATVGYSDADGAIYGIKFDDNSTDAQNDIVLHAFKYAADDVKVGESTIRVENPRGIRFATTVSKDFASQLGDNVTFGVLFTTAAKLGTAELTTDLGSGNYVDCVCAKWQTGLETETQKVYTSVLSGIPITYEGVNTQIYARAYFKVTYADGSNAIFYANTANNSLYGVASAATITSGVITNILNVGGENA